LDEQKAKMPPPPPDSSNTVLIDGGNKEIVLTNDDAIAAAAAVVVDASVTYSAASLTGGSTPVADPTAGSYGCETDEETGMMEPI
jgi:hypothetical protein